VEKRLLLKEKRLLLKVENVRHVNDGGVILKII